MSRQESNFAHFGSSSALSCSLSSETKLLFSIVCYTVSIDFKIFKLICLFFKKKLICTPVLYVLMNIWPYRRQSWLWTAPDSLLSWDRKYYYKFFISKHSSPPVGCCSAAHNNMNHVPVVKLIVLATLISLVCQNTKYLSKFCKLPLGKSLITSRKGNTTKRFSFSLDEAPFIGFHQCNKKAGPLFTEENKQYCRKVMLKSFHLSSQLSSFFQK